MTTTSTSPGQTAFRDPSRRISCPACHQRTLEPLLTLPSVPTMCNVLYATREEAQNVPRGDLDLGFCPACGLARNLAFDPALIDYSAPYENSLHFSPTFQSYATSLARRLAKRHSLASGRLLEVGCGSGNFLVMLAEASGAKALGFDPSHDPARMPKTNADVIIHRDWEPPPGITADLVCARHVLEHVDDPMTLGSRLGSWLSGRDAVAYVEVPNGEYLLQKVAVWDLIYEHPSSFTRASLSALFQRAGLGIQDLGTSFGDQFCWVEVGLRPKSPPTIPPIEPTAVAAEFRRAAASRIDKWSQRLDSRRATGQMAVWGAGTKGAMFLNLVKGGQDVDVVVDMNPYKHGRYVAGTGQLIVGPDDLSGQSIDHVIVMNRLYKEEISDQLARRGVRAHVEVA